MRFQSTIMCLSELITMESTSPKMCPEFVYIIVDILLKHKKPKGMKYYNIKKIFKSSISVKLMVMKKYL